MTKAEQKAFEPINGEVVPGAAIALRPPTPMSLMQMGMERGASVETMTQLFALHRELMKEEAQQAFDRAFAAFKSEAPKLEKTKEVSFGSNRAAYKYTPLDAIANTVGPLLAKHGLSYNWRQERVDESIVVTCILRHTQGHSIDNTLSAQADPSGSKNAIQAIGSAVTYLRRYTLLGVLGMATSDEDTDGMTMGNAVDYVSSIQAAGDMHELETTYKEAVREGLRAKDPQALKAFMHARDKREKELAA